LTNEQQVGVIGIGVMGSAMAGNLLRAGFTVYGYDPAERARTAFAEAGGVVLDSPRAVIEASAISITSLPSAAALAAAVTGETGIAAASGAAQIVIECSTLPLEAKQSAHDTMLAAGKILLDCPVSGTGAQAARKDLVILGSGDRAAFDLCAAVFEGMSRLQRFLGPFGAGSTMKFIANHLVTIHNVAAAEAMVLGMKAGIDPATLYDTLADSAGSSRMFQMRGPLMRDECYEPPTASIRTHLKDVSIIGAFAAALDCPLPLFTTAVQSYLAANAQGFGSLDTASVCTVLERAAGVDRTTLGTS
jgi:putative dehydrogenase